MGLRINEKPEWFALLIKVKAIREIGIASASDLAEFIKSPPQRINEWINGHKEPRAEKTLEIKNWIEVQEAKIDEAVNLDYVKIQKQLKAELETKTKRRK